MKNAHLRSKTLKRSGSTGQRKRLCTQPLIPTCIQKGHIHIVETGLAPIGANFRKWVRTNGRRETVGVVPCADPECLSTRVGARYDRSEMLLLSWALPVRSRLWGSPLSARGWHTHRKDHYTIDTRFSDRDKPIDSNKRSRRNRRDRAGPCPSCMWGIRCGPFCVRVPPSLGQGPALSLRRQYARRQHVAGLCLLRPFCWSQWGQPCPYDINSYGIPLVKVNWYER